MGRKGRAGVTAAAAAALAGACFMLGLFTAGENHYIPPETLPPSLVRTGVGHPDSENRLDLNTASFEKLLTLPGIGPATAVDIIAWREKNGPFRYPEELVEVPGIGENILNDLMDLIKAGGD